MTRFARRILTVLFVSTVAITALACDPLPDECELDDNVCENNTANRCYRPGPESRLKTMRIACGAAKTCVIPSDRDREPVCAQKDLPACPIIGARVCSDGVVSTCTAIATGATWVDGTPCSHGCKVDPTYGAECIY